MQDKEHKYSSLMSMPISSMLHFSFILSYAFNASHNRRKKAERSADFFTSEFMALLYV